ncbi:MAG: transposase family protein [Moorea sp. SIO2B7]|nr:transposase family protein [Moorena sp. SIO2B7]
MLISLIENLKKVNGFRKNRCQRHQLWVVLSIIILGIITGHTRYKQLDKFSKSESEKLIPVSWFSQYSRLVIKAESFESKQGSDVFVRYYILE